MRFRSAERAWILIVASLLLPLPGQAQRETRSSVEPQLRIGVTLVGIDTDEGPWPAAEFTYIGTTPRLWRAGVIGGFFASARGTLYGFGGVQLPVPLPLGMLARPSFSLGLYEKGRGMELGHVVEFRSSFVLERTISDRVTVSAMFYHLSNAGVGFKNPGLEAVGVAFAVPILSP